VSPGAVAAAIHDVEPASLSRCREIRDWLAERGIDRATLLAIPAPAGTPIDPDGDPARWLRQRRATGDAVAQHGLRHARVARVPLHRRGAIGFQGGGAAEFVGLDGWRTARALERGRSILRRAGLDPGGFVAPGYAYTRHLRRSLRGEYRWWADLIGVHRDGRSRLSPALCLGASTRLKRVTSPPLVRALGRVGAADGLLRVDVHPADFDHARSREALARLLGHAEGRAVLTYDDLS
jgi:predicted deacetylase